MMSVWVEMLKAAAPLKQSRYEQEGVRVQVSLTMPTRLVTRPSVLCSLDFMNDSTLSSVCGLSCTFVVGHVTVNDGSPIVGALFQTFWSFHA